MGREGRNRVYGKGHVIKKESEATGRYSHQSSRLGHNVSISPGQEA